MITVKKGVPEPPPDMGSKPEDVTQYAFAPVCDHDHVTGYGKTELNIKDLEVITACSTCGRPARYQSIRRTAEAQWCKICYAFSLDEVDRYCWQNRSLLSKDRVYWWTRAERVRNIVL